MCLEWSFVDMSYWTTRFLVSIITNLQVSVDNLHLRYEDEWSIPNVHK